MIDEVDHAQDPDSGRFGPESVAGPCRKPDILREDAITVLTVTSRR